MLDRAISYVCRLDPIHAIFLRITQRGPHPRFEHLRYGKVIKICNRWEVGKVRLLCQGMVASRHLDVDEGESINVR